MGGGYPSLPPTNHPELCRFIFFPEIRDDHHWWFVSHCENADSDLKMYFASKGELVERRFGEPRPIYELRRQIKGAFCDTHTTHNIIQWCYTSGTIPNGYLIPAIQYNGTNPTIQWHPHTSNGPCPTLSRQVMMLTMNARMAGIMTETENKFFKYTCVYGENKDLGIHFEFVACRRKFQHESGTF